MNTSRRVVADCANDWLKDEVYMELSKSLHPALQARCNVIGIRCWRVATEHRHVTMLQVMLCKGDTRCWHAADAAMPVVEGTIMLESSEFLAGQGHEKPVPTLQIGSSVT